MARLYSDEDFSFPVVGELRQLGHDVLTAQEAGHSNKGISIPSFWPSRSRATGRC